MIESLNRAFMYGESVFTTLRMENGSLRDWDYHFERLRRGVEFVYGPFTDTEDWVDLLRTRLESRVLAENGDKVIRITVFREQARGLLRTGLISLGDLRLHVSSSPFDPTRAEGRSVKLRTCAAFMRPQWWPSYLKAGNYLETILAQKVFLKPEDDDLLFLSPLDTVLESSVANIFVARHDKIYTAPAGPNVLEGIMRRKVLEIAPQIFSDVEETETSIDQLFKADAVFGSNSVRGIFLVSQIDGHEFKPSADFLAKYEKLRLKVLS